LAVSGPEGKPVETTTKVFILCRNRLLRESISRILTKKTDFEIVVAQGPHAISSDTVGRLGTDVLVLDSLEFLVAPPGSPRETPSLGRLTKCVLIAMEDNQDHFLSAVRCGARGYVFQEASAADVVSVVRVVAEGQAVCPPNYARVLFDYVVTQAGQGGGRERDRVALTGREQQLIPLIERGLSNKEIGSYFDISEQTVKNHIHRILKKLGASDRLSLCAAYRNQVFAFSTKGIGYSA